MKGLGCRVGDLGFGRSRDLGNWGFQDPTCAFWDLGC